MTAAPWPPKALNENAIGFVYNHAYEQSSCARGDSVEDAHNEACHAVYKHGFHNATGGRPEHPAVAELRDAAREILFEFPGDDSDDDDVNRIVKRERRDRLAEALKAFAHARGEGLCTCTDGSCAHGATPQHDHDPQ